MKYRQMGKTGLMVSEICLGTMTFGNQLEEKGAIEVIDYALDNGINFIDEADLYVEGLSEQIVGKALKGKRSGVILATKVGAWKVGTDVNKVGLSRRNIMDGIEDSLRRLQTDYIDLYYAHKPDPIVPIEETLRAFDDLIRQGKVRYIACSNYPLWRLSKAICVSAVQGLARFDCIQPPYNLLGRDIEDEILPLCESEGIGVCVYNPLAAGLLSGKHDPGKEPAKNTRFSLAGLGEVYRERYWRDSNFEAISRLKAVADAHGRSMPQFALAGALSNPAITSIICGVTSLKQLEENIGAVDVELTQEELDVCDEVWLQLRPPRFSYGSQQVER